MNKKIVSTMIFVMMIAVVSGLFIMDNGSSNQVRPVLEAKAQVLEVNNDAIISSGLASIGHQDVTVEILSGMFEGQTVRARNFLIGSLDTDVVYQMNDKILIALNVKDGNVTDAKTIEMYRQDGLFMLLIVFIVCLILYAGFIGLKALFSFVMSLFIIWSFLIPGLLDGRNPLIFGVLTLALLTAIITFSVAGFTKKGLVSCLGTVFGLIVTVVITVFFGDLLELYGLTAPYAQTLLFSGHLNLDLRGIFYLAIIIGAAGAAMDIAMDIAASMEEINLKMPNIGRKELIQSGFNVGRAVIGTMTTTLLLAYSGGYLTLLMLFMSKETSLMRMLNLKVVTAEIMRTLVGSIGLVLVAPITAILAGWVYTMEHGASELKEGLDIGSVDQRSEVDRWSS